MVQTQSREELIELARRNYGRLFSNYDSPVQALEVWMDHLEDVYTRGLINEARGIVSESNGYVQLDSRLSDLIVKQKRRLLAVESLKRETGSEGGFDEVVGISRRSIADVVMAKIFIRKDK